MPEKERACKRENVRERERARESMRAQERECDRKRDLQNEHVEMGEEEGWRERWMGGVDKAPTAWRQKERTKVSEGTYTTKGGKNE